MNENAIGAVAHTAAAAVYARWRAEPKYRLNNLAGDPDAWPFIHLDELEALAFDQCIVFGATFPGDAGELAAAARRDAVVRQARDVAWAVYRAYGLRAEAEPRRRFARALVAAIEGGAGSAGSLLPIMRCDKEASVVAEAGRLRSRLAATPLV